MEVVKKKNARIFEFKIKNFKGIEVFEHSFEDGKPCVLYGNNGSGKSSIIEGIYMAFMGKKVPFKFDNAAGPYSMGSVKKAMVKIGIEADPGVIEFGEKFFIHFGITEAGTVSLKITDDKDETINTTPPRDKIKKLLGMFLDPVELANTIKEPNGDKKFAERLCEMVGLDLKPFVDTEASLFEEFQAENVEKKRQEGVFASLEEPQEDWAKKYTNPEEISKQLQNFNALKSENEQRIRNVTAEEDEADRLCQSSLDLYEEIAVIKIEGQALKGAYNNQVLSHNSAKESLVELQEKNNPIEWTGTKNIQAEIQKLTEELGKFQTHEQEEARKKQEIDSSTQEINLSAERLVASQNEISSKKEAMTAKITEKESKDNVVCEQFKKIELSKKENIEKPWEGEKDPEGKLEPEEYLNGKMANVTKWNKQFADREAYEKADKGLKAVDASIQSISKKRKGNQTAKSNAVASVKDKFPHPGITVDENTVWYDKNDRRGPRSINDWSDGETRRICTDVLIAGNTGDLNVLLIRAGYCLDPDARQDIYATAKEHNYDVVLETIETSEVGALHIVDGRVDSINQPLKGDAALVQHVIDLKDEKKEVDGSDFNWGDNT